ncbi:hypothetical protein AAFF_G00400080 [Aldrovandia affinis]|uniref:Uncharacterized protein n=1 Tax=Aldrovandia affinis TaxID=143900 RepID=A0AAD7R3P9_9TELE|nr:hypothetical protein AAFF_G00400080 [Aldrovandia affinis]
MEERIQELEIQLKYLQEVRAGSAQGNAELSEDGPVPNTVALERERVVYLQQDFCSKPHKCNRRPQPCDKPSDTARPWRQW